MDNVIFASWSVYRDLLYPIIKRTQSRNDHKFAAQIDKALSEDRAFLFLGSDGFFVLQPLYSESAVLISFAWNQGGNAITRYQSTVEELARFLAVDSLMLETKVAQLAPALLANGWNRTGVTGGIECWQKTITEDA